MASNTTAPAQEKSKAKEHDEAKENGHTAGRQGHTTVHVVGLTVEEHVKTKESRKTQCCKHCLEILFVVLSIIAIIKSIAEIVLTVSTAIFTKLYDSEQSGRLVGMVLLALLAAVVISILINAQVAVFRSQAKPLHAATIVIFIVAIVQAVIIILAVKVTHHDELQLTRSLQQSFLLAKENNPRHSGIWATTQYEMSCCGLYGPDDYRKSNLPEFFSPDVPISCCTTYDPSRSDLVQERERELCKRRKTYYNEGCNDLVMEGFKTSAAIVVALTSSLIIVEVILAILAAILTRKIKKQKLASGQNKENSQPEA